MGLNIGKNLQSTVSVDADKCLHPGVDAWMGGGAFNDFCKKPTSHVFPSEKTDGHLKDPKKAVKRIKTHMGVLDLRIHDLRRTLGSYTAINGTSLLIIGKALNHKSQVSTTIYARLSQDPVLSAINIASDFIKSNS
ncbi:hypothetical protein E2R66_25015 [Mucilaginibacter psychrotolerans]|uniref:Tyr recombinase domain-containing protein n=2 Tax=Mucilaginibacter psychrotolerans TaxID=1524096 RepID=A0A4Y8S3Z5_9SPHI|nr:hypothetical protein E2R66_25015 [Mucilaginibacter psychrotolerans]